MRDACVDVVQLSVYSNYAFQDALDWLDDNQDASTDHFKSKLKSVEAVVDRIMRVGTGSSTDAFTPEDL